jgi:hypothetical protein
MMRSISKAAHAFAGMAVCVILAVFVAGCSMPYSMPDATRFSPSKSSVIVVGKIEIDPPIDTEFEQNTHWAILGDGAILNKIVMATGTDPGPVETGNIVFSQWQNALEAELGKTFYLVGNRQRTYLKGAMMQMDVATQERVWFPGGVYFDVPEGADAVYVGTLRYTRGDFYAIKNMEVIDEYASAAKEFSSEFGNGKKLQRSLLKSAL